MHKGFLSFFHIVHVNKIDGSQVVVSLIGPLNLIGVWFSEDQKSNIVNTHV